MTVRRKTTASSTAGSFASHDRSAPEGGIGYSSPGYDAWRAEFDRAEANVAELAGATAAVVAHETRAAFPGARTIEFGINNESDGHMGLYVLRVDDVVTGYEDEEVERTIAESLATYGYTRERLAQIPGAHLEGDTVTLDLSQSPPLNTGLLMTANERWNQWWDSAKAVPSVLNEALDADGTLTFRFTNTDDGDRANLVSSSSLTSQQAAAQEAVNRYVHERDDFAEIPGFRMSGTDEWECVYDSATVR